MLPLSFATFLVFGVVLVLLGANQAELARDLHLDLARSGLLASGLASGTGIGLVVAGPLVDRGPRRPIFLGATLLAALSLLSVDERMGFPRALAHAALLGFGIGLYATLISGLVVERYRSRATRPMAAVHAATPLGAMLGPLLAGWAAAHAHWTSSFHGTGAAHLALAAAALFVHFPAPHPSPAGATHPLRSVLSRAAVPLALIAFAYVGVEATLIIFAVPYASAALGLDPSRGLTAISALWLGLFAGRLALLAVAGRLDAPLLGAAGFAGAAVLAAGAALGLRPVELYYGLAGLSLGFVFPLMLTLAGQRFPDARASAVGLVTGAGALGGFAVPFLHGALGDRVGVALSVGSLAAWSLLIAAAAIALRRAP